MSLLRLCLGSLFSVAAAGCSPALVNLAVPSSGYTLHSDLPYRDEPLRLLDLYVPDALAENASTVLFFYGGSWQSGSKEYYKAVGQTLAEKGILVAIADYSQYPGTLYPQFLHDGAAAFRYVRTHIAEYGGDPSRIFLAGHSAGAYNAVMLASGPVFLAREGFSLNAIRGVIGMTSSRWKTRR